MIRILEVLYILKSFRFINTNQRYCSAKSLESDFSLLPEQKWHTVSTPAAAQKLGHCCHDSASPAPAFVWRGVHLQQTAVNGKLLLLSYFAGWNHWLKWTEHTPWPCLNASKCHHAWTGSWRRATYFLVGLNSLTNILVLYITSLNANILFLEDECPKVEILCYTDGCDQYFFFFFFSSREPVLKLPEEKPLFILIVQLFLLRKWTLGSSG